MPCLRRGDTISLICETVNQTNHMATATGVNTRRPVIKVLLNGLLVPDFGMTENRIMKSAQRYNVFLSGLRLFHCVIWKFGEAIGGP